MIEPHRAAPGAAVPHPALALAVSLAAVALAPAVASDPLVPVPTNLAAQEPEPDERGGAAVPMLPVRYDADSGKVTLEVGRLGEELLYLNTLAAGLGTTSPLLDRGQVGIEAVVRFERHGPRVLLVRDNLEHRALTRDAALRRSVEESFPRSVLAAFEIVEERDGALVVDATDFVLSDVFDVVGRVKDAGLGTVSLDRDRSHVDAGRTRAFPDNTEVRAVLTFAAEEPHAELRRHAPDGRSVTLEQHHSFVRLPGPGYRPRAFHPRAGLFPTVFFDFAQGLESDYRRRWAMRWRLEPSDPEAYVQGELVEPVEPIVYYLDPAIPEPYRSAFIEGGLWWNEVLEAAGFRNAFRIEPLPEGVDPMDARYSVIQWVHRRERGPSVGPSYRDPRTGEILKTVVRMDSYRSLVNHDIYMGLVPAAGPEGLPMTAEAFAMARRRQHSAHEIGHTLGLAHNFIAATQGRASVMDYPVPLVRPAEDGGIDISEAYRPGPGAHDSLAIRYAYTWYPRAEAEREGLRTIMEDAAARGLRFITGFHAAPSGALPDATQWVEGSDMLSALERTMAVRRRLIDAFDERALRLGEPLAALNKRFAHVYLHHRAALQGATKVVGGMEFRYALAGEGASGSGAEASEGGPTSGAGAAAGAEPSAVAEPPTRPLPPEEQRRALSLVLSAIAPEALRVPDRVAALIPPSPFGWDGDETPIPSRAGPAFDPLTVAHSLAQEVVDGLLHPQRMARVASFHARDAASPSPDEVLGALVTATWGAGGSGGGGVPRAGAGGAGSEPADEPALRRVAQRAALDGLLDLAGSPDATPEVRAAAEARLAALRADLEARPGPADRPAERAHRAAARRDIDRYFEGRDDPAKRPRPAPIPLPWP